jgi:hypothetical protein
VQWGFLASYDKPLTPTGYFDLPKALGNCVLNASADMDAPT